MATKIVILRSDPLRGILNGLAWDGWKNWNTKQVGKGNAEHVDFRVYSRDQYDACEGENLPYCSTCPDALEYWLANPNQPVQCPINVARAFGVPV